ncbi:hypothetical protein Sgly_2822 [Syntrophobotulus glycolicus DSM 8271]|uniref:Uncharacterized protein n=1 Tax=Syntrophobotulus glycolicus (strain DSM 8271 / FlGlyR) TaxID=645991 RepID=F0SYI0_SYNGF|nr:hypothetical protein Sgly_2822 [Syntrophobotulus glycolicus DSM 8271]
MLEKESRLTTMTVSFLKRSKDIVDHRGEVFKRSEKKIYHNQRYHSKELRKALGFQDLRLKGVIHERNHNGSS